MTGTAAFARAAHLLAGLRQPRVRPLAAVGEPDGAPHHRTYADGRLALQVVPRCTRRPVAVPWSGTPRSTTGCASASSPPSTAVRGVAEVEAPRRPCPRRRLPQQPAAHGRVRRLTLIDFGFWSRQRSASTSASCSGEVQLGSARRRRCPARAGVPAGLRRGPARRGLDLDVTTVARGHALWLLMFTALSALPFDLFDAPPTPAAIETSRQRAAAAQFVLDLVAATGRRGAT